MSTIDLLDLISKGGVVALLILILISGGRAWWVWGWAYKSKSKEADDWQAIAKAQVDNAEAITKQAERALDLADRMQNRRRASDERHP